MKLNLKDLNGTPLSVNDEVLVYAQRYERTQESSGVWAVDQTRPLPVLDVPLARGVIEWDEGLLTYIVKYDWVCALWEGKAACQMGGGEYTFERLV